jgi:predicted nucleic acid-binding protein
MIIDAYAWIEYLFGSEKGRKVRDLLEKKECYTLESNLAEIYEWARKNNEDFAFFQKIIITKSKLLPINRADWLRAVEIKIEQKRKYKDFGIIDALLIAKQELMRCEILTGDKHFQNLKNVIYIS